jgi:hypothetical protein
MEGVMQFGLEGTFCFKVLNMGKQKDYMYFLFTNNNIM